MEKTQSNKQGGDGVLGDPLSKKINNSLDTAEKAIEETKTWLSDQKKSKTLLEKDRGQEQPGGRGGGLGISKAVEALDGKEKEGRDR